MEIAGAMCIHLRKLCKEAYNSQKSVKNINKDIKFLKKELRSINAALRMVGEVPPNELDTLVRDWASALRGLSYDIEDIVDTFTVRMEDLQPANPDCITGLKAKIINLFNNDVTSHKIATAIKDIKVHIRYVGDSRHRYMVDDAASRLATTIDPRLQSLYVEATELVGIDKASDDLVRRLTAGDDLSEQQLKVVSLVGFGGLGKTTLAVAVYRKLIVQFDCGAFISLSWNPDMKKVLKDMLCQLNRERYRDIHEASWDQTKLTDELQTFLEYKRYFIVIDDIWDKNSWLTIKRAMVDNNCGSTIITTTRSFDVAEEVGGAYKLKPLSPGDSKKLFSRRIFGEECPGHLTEVSDKILKKCDGIPLAIISVASFLCSKPCTMECWYEVCNSFGSLLASPVMEGMRSVLLYSYYNLPYHLRTCLLYISVFPEDYVIRRDRLVWIWIAEGFVQVKQGSNLFELGQSYLDELLKIDIVQEVDINDGDGMVKYCRVRTVVLELIRYLSSEENFVTILNDIPGNSLEKIRRLSLQNSEVQHTAHQATTPCIAQVRSVTVFSPGLSNLMPPLSSFQLLRVMDLEGCDLKKSYNLKHIGNLLHLRYLGLRGTLIAKLPKQIGDLRFLQILDLARTEIKELPSTVVLLRRLICLYVDDKTRLPYGMGNLTSLEQLSKISGSESPHFVRELRSLTELRALDIVLHELDESLKKDLFESLCNLQKMQTLHIYTRDGSKLDLMRECLGNLPSLEQATINVEQALSDKERDQIQSGDVPEMIYSVVPEIEECSMSMDSASKS